MRNKLAVGHQNYKSTIDQLHLIVAPLLQFEQNQINTSKDGDNSVSSPVIRGTIDQHHLIVAPLLYSEQKHELIQERQWEMN